MRNLFLSLAFMLVGTFAFANTSDNSIDLNKIESLINVENLNMAANDFNSTCSIPVYFNDGGSGDFGIGETTYEYPCGQDSNSFFNELTLWIHTTFPGFTSAIIKFGK